jgi:hypothetical protein
MDFEWFFFFFEFYFTYAFLGLLISYILFLSQSIDICELGAHSTLIFSHRDGGQFSNDWYTRKGMIFLGLLFDVCVCMYARMHACLFTMTRVRVYIYTHTHI